MSEAEIKVTEDFAKVQINNNEETQPSQPKKDKPLGGGPVRRVERNKSGPNGMRAGPSRRAPPGRSKSHKIGRPVFSKDLPAEPQRGVARNTSGRLRSAPGRTRSFGRSTPDRASNGNPLKKAYKREQSAGQYSVDTADTDSVCDSVFTSASNQTCDSIMLRKKQFTTGDGPEGAAGTAAALRRPRTTEAQPSFEFDESLHTVDSINLNHRHLDGEYDEDADLSVFSESFASTATYDDMSDYDEMDGEVIREEVEIENIDEQSAD